MLINPCLNYSSLFERNTEEWHLLSLHHHPDQHPLAVRGEVKQMFHREQVRQQPLSVQVMKKTVWGQGRGTQYSRVTAGDQGGRTQCKCGGGW